MTELQMETIDLEYDLEDWKMIQASLELLWSMHVKLPGGYKDGWRIKLLREMIEVEIYRTTPKKEEEEKKAA